MYTQTSRTSHSHRFFVDNRTGDELCLCGKLKGEKKNKFNARKKELDDYVYDSGFEAEYAAELQVRLRAGDILGFERQFPVPIYVNGYHICTCKVDFLVYERDGTKALKETKGVETADYRIKKKLIEAVWLVENPDYTYEVIKQKSWKR